MSVGFDAERDSASRSNFTGTNDVERFDVPLGADMLRVIDPRSGQSQRDCGLQHKVGAPSACRWAIVKQIINRNAVAANVARELRMGMAATALRLGNICGR